MTIAEADRREKVSEQSIGRWKAEFLEAGKTALAAGRSGPSTREQQLEAEIADLTQALGEAAVELLPVVAIVTDNGGPFRSFQFEAFIELHPELAHIRTKVKAPDRTGHANVASAR